MKCKLSFPGPGSLCRTVFSLGKVTQQDGSEAGRQVQSRDPRVWSVDLWTGETPKARLAKGHDAFKEDEVIGGCGHLALWDLQACSREGETEGGRQVDGGEPSLGCQFCS